MKKVRSEGSRWRVTEAHDAPSCKVLRLKAGDLLRFERRPTEWEGWIWCIDREGIEGWVPEKWVSVEGDSCAALREYESVELGVSRGEVLTVLETESGWAWAVNSRNESGWVPLRCLERLSPDDVSP
jgi:hypothetical protein